MEQNKRYSIFHSTIFRIIVVIIILVLPINIMTIIFSMITLRQSQAEVSREIQNTLNMAGDTLASTLETSVRQLSYLSVSSTDFSVVASKSQMEDKPERFYTSYANVGTALDNVLSGFDQLDVVYFVFPETDYLVSRGYPGLVYREYRNVLESMPDQEDEENAWRYMEIGGSAVLVSHDSWHDMDFGVVLNLERTLNKLNLPELEEGNLFLFTNREETLFTEEGESFFYQAGMDLEAVENSSRYHVYRCPLENFDLTLIQIVDDQYSTFTIPTILRVMQYLSIILAVAVIPLLLYYISRMVNRPLNRLIKAINLIERGDLDYRIPEKSNGTEFEQINRSFNGMMEQIKNLKIDVYEQELEKKNIKMQYLSQQIQPHFILNALNLLYSYEPEEYPLIQKMILCISKYFRYIVKMNEEFVELSQEMNHIKNYFEIQRARFPGLFFSIVEYEEDLGKALIPPLIVQNFAENAIKHSLKIGNRITILVVADYCPEDEEKKTMRIRLADTGEGISDELVEKIEIFKKTGVHQEGLGVGIQNAIERLKSLYDDKSTVRIGRDEAYGGTNVEIILPIYYERKVKEENDEDPVDR